MASWISRLFVSRWDNKTYAVIANQLRDGRVVEVGLVGADVLTGPELEQISLKLAKEKLLQGNNMPDPEDLARAIMWLIIIVGLILLGIGFIIGRFVGG